MADGGIEFPLRSAHNLIAGSQTLFGIPGVEEHSMTMRGVADAVRLRNRVIERFEEVSSSATRYQSPSSLLWLSAAGLPGSRWPPRFHTLVHENLAPDYPNIDPYRVRIYLIEALPNILPELDPALRRAARARLLNERIEVLTGAMAEEITGDRVKLKGGKQIDTENVIWTAGNRPNQTVQDLGLPHDERTA